MSDEQIPSDIVAVDCPLSITWLDFRSTFVMLLSVDVDDKAQQVINRLFMLLNFL